METSDRDLIREYARNGAEASFGELVHRHVDLVYSTAFRVLRNAGLAEEVSQRVFVALARNAEKLEHRGARGMAPSDFQEFCLGDGSQRGTASAARAGGGRHRESRFH